MDEFFAPKLGQYRRSGDELIFCCPFCKTRTGKPDTKFHLYVNPLKLINGIRGWFVCHRCGARGPASRLLSDQYRQSTAVSKWREVVERFVTGGKRVLDDQRSTVKMPLDYVRIIRGSDAHGYLLERGITNEQISVYRLGFGTEDLRELEPEQRKLYAGSGRIIFPDYDADGNVTYWVARSYVNHKVKYKNPPDSDASSTIYNLVRASSYDSVVITEGVISAIRSGYNAVATYGKGVTKRQIEMLASVAWDHYYIALDGDAVHEALKVGESLQRCGYSVSLVQFDYNEDPASVSDMGTRLEQSIQLNLIGRLRFALRT